MKIIAVTNRRLCVNNFLVQIEKIAQISPYAIILREKDMDIGGYTALYNSCKEICDRYKTLLIAHSFLSVSKNLHLPYEMFMENLNKTEAYERIGVSVHSSAEAAEAEKNGASYLIAGHIFATDSKKALPPRGLDFLYEVCSRVKIPVFAIGGINEENASLAIQNGAAGICVMSKFMKGELFSC